METLLAEVLLLEARVVVAEEEEATTVWKTLVAFSGP